MTINLPLPQQSSRGVNRTAIEWADYAVGSPFRFRDKETGELLANACVKLSSGCAHCYAEAIGQRFKTGRPYTKANMDRLEPLLDEGVIRHILTFRPSPVKGATGYKNGRPRPLLFLGDMTDIFGEWVPDHLIDAVIAAVMMRPDVDVIVLTKRAKKMADYTRELYRENGRLDTALQDGHWPWPDISTTAQQDAADILASECDHIPNLWLYVSVEDQATADERIPHLLACPAAVRGVSAEPLVGPVDVSGYLPGQGCNRCQTVWSGRDPRCPRCSFRDPLAMATHERKGLDHAIIGGESGPGARPCNVEWIRSLVRQGAEAGTATFVKQLGARPVFEPWHSNAEPTVGKWYEPTVGDDFDTRHIRDRKGGTPSEWPDDITVRQMPGGGR